ncbi:cytochrome P450 [Coniella lustricola]|uniref:Cytochrome P450 n=1 Tax=Coniella lustricola TaxID=2025994 RepID=A0A2T3A5F2_9PEZI|nr:cytochrome P450 [Coniella lustricola]
MFTWLSVVFWHGAWVALSSTVSATVWLASILVLSLLAVAIYRLALHPLARVPGPRLAAVSSCWYAYQVRNGRMLRLGKTLHRQYGPVVRVAPNEVWCASKDAYKVIYSPTAGYEKSEFYLATSLLKPSLSWDLALEVPDTLDLLAERDMKRYRLQRRLIGPVYHINNLRRHEHSVDLVLERAIAQLHTLQGAEVDLKEWMHIIVVECLSAVSLSWSPGYLKDKSDGASGKHAYMGWRRKSVFGLFPAMVILESLSKSAGRAFATLWQVTYHTPKKGFKPFFPAVQRKISQRVKVALWGKPQKDERQDIVADLIQLHKDRPEFNEQYLRRMAITNFGAGHETLTSTLISAFAMIGSHDGVQSHIANELQSVSKTIQYESAMQLSFTQASIKEAQRLYPVIGMSLPRKVPEGDGIELHRLHLPPGTIIGCSPVSLHRDTDIFGPDAEVYRPQRWLQADQRKDMDRYNLIYGGGSRICPGKQLAEMLVSKIVPTLFKHFQVEINLPSEEEMPYYFMAMLTGVKARFVARADVLRS